jgi:hypothetical protein
VSHATSRRLAQRVGVVIERVEQPDNCVAGELPIPRHMGKRLSAEACGRGPLSSEAATSGIWWRSQRM